MNKNELKIFIPFSKIDKKKKMVFGYVSTEMEDSQGEIVDKNAIREAWEDYMKFANIREMHQPSAVGVTKEFMHDKKGTWIGAKIVDKVAWEKVIEEVYKGFSIGGMVLKKIGKRIKELILNEISLVDRPANPEAIFDMIKRGKNGLIEVNKSRILLGEGQKVESLVKTMDNFMKEEIETKTEKARRKKKESEGTEEGKKKSEERTEESKTSEDQTIPPEEGKEKEEQKDTVENKEFGTESREQSTVPNVEKKDGEEDSEEKEEGKEEESKESEQTEGEKDAEETEETKGAEETKETEETEQTEETEEGKEGEEKTDLNKDVSEVVVLSEVAGHLKWLKSAFENNKRPKEVIKYVEKALENVMAAIRVEAKRENTGKAEKIGKIENFNDLGKLLEQKLGEISEKVEASGLAKAKEIIKEVSSLKERIKELEDKPVGQRPKTVFTIEKGGEGGDEPKDILTIKKEIQKITEDIDKVHSEGLTLIGGTNSQKEQEVKDKLAKLGKKLAEKQRELNQAVYP